jgi:hypothetical protein
MEYINGKMVENTKVNTSMTRRMASERTAGRTEKDI